MNSIKNKIIVAALGITLLTGGYLGINQALASRSAAACSCCTCEDCTCEVCECCSCGSACTCDRK